MCVDTEVPPASGAEEEAGGEVRDGRSHRSAAHLHRLVSPALHVADQICGWSRQQAAGRLSDHHAWRLPGEVTCPTCLYCVVMIIFYYHLEIQMLNVVCR